MSVNFSEDDLKIPLLITKLNVIKKNNEISIELRKQKKNAIFNMLSDYCSINAYFLDTVCNLSCIWI